ncbi:unnamed protein product [Strongylus vulgaris]|uniref:Uncharacterized protein n=1 Tax=Strongylus vulgaris TaxID=40348 RepID=A0A3P7JJ12_STRVU|nr:unnamed protein product [Strongylus vulgaris]
MELVKHTQHIGRRPPYRPSYEEGLSGRFFTGRGSFSFEGKTLDVRQVPQAMSSSSYEVGRNMVRSRNRGCLHGLIAVRTSAGRIRGGIPPVEIMGFDTGVDERKLSLTTFSWRCPPARMKSAETWSDPGTLAAFMV